LNQAQEEGYFSIQDPDYVENDLVESPPLDTPIASRTRFQTKIYGTEDITLDVHMHETETDSEENRLKFEKIESEIQPDPDLSEKIKMDLETASDELIANIMKYN
jgi:hypothetical protein